MKCIKKWFIVTALISFLAMVVSGCDETGVKIDTEAINSVKNEELFLKFTDDFPDIIPITCKIGDVTKDGVDDLILIYKTGEHIRMRVLINKEIYTDEIPAPVENQTIAFKDIDKKDEMEFIISGSKLGNIGYAIYRITDNQTKDLFGEGMDDCC